MTKPNNIPVVDGELISVIDVINKNEDFDYLVPAYQRCYRWTEENVNDLLKDFVDFFDRYHEDKEQKYCLQPLTLKDKIDEAGNCHKIIIDGQQRLTTLYILLAYLNRECTLVPESILSKEKHSIVYEGRSKTEKYLRDLCDMSYTTEMIITKYNRDGGTWTRDIDCMANAYAVIKEYFAKNNDSSDKIISLFSDGRICFIRQTYQKDSDTEIKLFNGINVGRTELTDAELIRAKLILSDSEKATSRAIEWDEIEHCLQNNKMWYFLTDEKNNDASRILFIFNVIRDSSGIEWDTQKKHSTYRFFQEYALGDDGKFVKGNTFEKDNLNVFWDRSKELYEIFCKWFTDVEIYNYVGLLLTDKSEKSPSANNLVDKYFEVNTRSEFIAYLKSEILYSFDDRDITYIWPYEEKQSDANKRLVNALFSMPKKNDYGNNAFLDQLYKFDNTSEKNTGIKITVLDKNDKTVISDVVVNITRDGHDVTTDKTNEYGIFTIPINGKPDFGKYSVSVNDVENYAIDSSDKTKEVEINKDNKSGDIVFEFAEKIEDYNKTAVFKSLSYSGRRAEKKVDEYNHRERCHHFLLWSNCELLISQMKNCMAEDRDVVFDMYRFPFDSYKTDHPDVEHVDSFVDMREESNFLKDKDEQRFWLECVIPLINGKKVGGTDKTKETENAGGTVNTDGTEKAEDAIKVILAKWDKGEITEALDIVESFFNNSGLQKNYSNTIEEKTLFNLFEDRRKIGNLTLLDKNINRGYKNFPFNIKRQDIINKSLGGIYVYPCTKMVFLKEFDPNAAELMSWNSDDYYNYWRFLLNMFIECFCSDKDRKYNTEILAKTAELIKQRRNK